MDDGPDSIVLRFLRGLDAKVDRLADDMREVKQRLGALAEGLALQAHAIASISRRVDRLDERLERVERRPDLVAA
jgi:archaellum component FlaC